MEIVDVNDNAPRFPEDRIVHQLSEAAEVGSTFVVPAAVDPDSRRNGVARYELRPARDGAFRLSVRHNAIVEADSDLRVVLVDKLDREVNDRYQVVIMTMTIMTIIQSVTDFYHVYPIGTIFDHPRSGVCIILVVSVCLSVCMHTYVRQTITFENLDVVRICTCGISPPNTGQVHI